MPRRNPLSRRQFLSRIGAGAALLPLLESERSEAACLSQGPKRVVIVTWGEGAMPSFSGRSSWVSGSGTDFKIPPLMSSLAPYRPDLIFLDGVSYRFLYDSMSDEGKAAYKVEGGGHASAQGILTGLPIPHLVDDAQNYLQIGAGPSIDHHIGSALMSRGLPGNLCLGAWIVEGTYWSWAGKNQPIVPKDDPWDVWNTYFAGQTPGSAPPGGGSPALDGLLKGRKSVLDAVREDLGRFRRSLGVADQAKIDRHLEGFRDIEKQLTMPAISRPGSCASPPVGAKVDRNASSNFPTVLKLQMDLLVALLAADVARVVTLQITSGRAIRNDLTFPGLATRSGPIAMSHHEVVHSQDTDAMYTINEFFYQQFAYLLKRLTDQDYAEGGQRMLDNTAVWFVNEMEEGNSHGTANVPCILAGSCGGYFKTGRSLNANGKTQNAILVALANAMGTPTPNGTFGEPSYGGELTILR